MIRLEDVTQYVVIAGLMGAIVWDLLTWWWGLPTSSSHALIGGVAGAGGGPARGGARRRAKIIGTGQVIVLGAPLCLRGRRPLPLAAFLLLPPPPAPGGGRR